MGITRQEALDCLRSNDLLGIGMEADALRRRLHPEGVVTYQCVYEMKASGSAISLPSSIDAVRVRCSDVASLPALPDVCCSARNSSDSLWLEISIPIEMVSDLRIAEALPQLATCGINSVAVDVRRANGDYASTAVALMEFYRAVHIHGMRTNVAIPFGGGESHVARLDLLDSVRNLQDEFGCFLALAPVAVDDPTDRELDSATAVERLKMLAVARMYLDNIQHIQSPQVGPGLKVLQMGLQFGANDTELRQPQAGTTEQDLRRVIRDAGLMPAERNGAHTAMFLR